MKLILRVTLWFLYVQSVCMAGVYFSNTAESVVEKRYSKYALKGEEIVSIRLSKSSLTTGANKQIYTLFISATDVTYINFEQESIVSIEGAGLDKDIIVGFDPSKTTDSFSLKARHQTIGSKTIQVSLESGNKIYIKVIAVAQHQANSIVNFLAIKQDAHQGNNQRSQDHSKRMLQLFTDILKDGVQQVQVDLVKHISDSELRLVNINRSGTTYYCMLEFKGKDNLALDTKEIAFEIRELHTGFLNIKRQKQVSYPVRDIMIHTVNSAHQIAVISFELPKKYLYFEFNLGLSQNRR